MKEERVTSLYRERRERSQILKSHLLSERTIILKSEPREQHGVQRGVQPWTSARGKRPPPRRRPHVQFSSFTTTTSSPRRPHVHNVAPTSSSTTSSSTTSSPSSEGGRVAGTPTQQYRPIVLDCEAFVCLEKQPVDPNPSFFIVPSTPTRPFVCLEQQQRRREE